MAGAQGAALRTEVGTWATLLGGGPVAGLSDGELLDRCHAGSGASAEAALGALVVRHSTLVWRTCRALLDNDADASDAFQATFLILVRRAGTIRRGDAVAPWLGGVARRVAARARVESARRQQREAVAARRAGLLVEAPPTDPLGEVAALIRAELAQLPDRDRAVILCDLDDLTETEVADRLGCPLGTVRSRLHRARGRLRARLAARGLDPAGALGLLPCLTAGPVPSALMASTARLLGGLGAQLGPGAVVAPTVVDFISSSHRRIAMLSLFALGSLGTILVGLAPVPVGPRDAVPPASRQDPVPAPAPALATRPAEPRAKPSLNLDHTTGARRTRPKPTPEAMAEEYRAIVAEYDALRTNAKLRARAGKTRLERRQIEVDLSPDPSHFARRMADLATLDPQSPVARDAAVWVLTRTNLHDAGNFGGAAETAVNLVIQHHADDPEVVRVGLGLGDAPNRRFDELLDGCYANATTREAKGLARLAYAQSLESKVVQVRQAIENPERARGFAVGLGERLKPVAHRYIETNDQVGYKQSLRQMNPKALQEEAERLYREVIADYADIPYITSAMRRLEAEVAEPLPADATPEERAERARDQRTLQHKQTLGQVAQDHLRRVVWIYIGSTAPAIDEADVRTGQPVRLTDHKGQVVYLVPWTDADEVARGQIAQLQAVEQRERERGRPFAVIGIAVAATRDEARAMIDRAGVTWPNVFEPSGFEVGAVFRAYQILHVQDTFVIDRNGRIAARGVSGSALDAVLDRLHAPAILGP